MNEKERAALVAGGGVMKCIDCDYEEGKRHDCTAAAIGKHGLCAKHLARRIRYIRHEIFENEHDMWLYLNDAKAHKRFGHHRSHSIASVRDARYYGHRVLRLRRELRKLEALA